MNSKDNSLPHRDISLVNQQLQNQSMQDQLSEMYQGNNLNTDQNDQDYDQEDDISDSQPTQEELEQYGRLLGMDPIQDREFLYIAKQGIKAQVEYPWTVVKNDSQSDQQAIIFRNVLTGEEQSDHPEDIKYKQWFEHEKMKKQIMNQQNQLQHPGLSLYSPIPQTITQSPFIPQSQAILNSQVLQNNPQMAYNVSNFNQQQQQQQQIGRIVIQDGEESAIEFDERQIVNQQDFETFNPTQDTRTNLQGQVGLIQSHPHHLVNSSVNPMNILPISSLSSLPFDNNQSLIFNTQGGIPFQFTRPSNLSTIPNLFNPSSNQQSLPITQSLTPQQLQMFYQQVQLQNQIQAQQNQIMNSQNFSQQIRAGDISVNTSFQTDINTFVNSINLQFQREFKKQIEQYGQRKHKELQLFSDSLKQQKIMENQEKQEQLQHKLSSMKEDLELINERKLQELKNQIELDKQRRLIQKQDHMQSEVFQLEMQKIQRSYNQKIKYEQEQLQTLQNLEIHRIKLQYQQRLTLQKQKMQFEFQQQNEDTLSTENVVNYKNQCLELESLRIKLEDDVQNLRDQIQSDHLKEFQELQKQLENQVLKVEQRVQKKFEIKIKEEKFSSQQKFYDIQDKKEAYFLELREQKSQRLEVEKERLILEQRDQLRELQIESDKLFKQDKEEIKSALIFKKMQAKNQLKLQLYKGINLSEQQANYKLQRDIELSNQKNKIEKEYNDHYQELLRKINIDNLEISKHERIIKETQSIKNFVKEQKKKKQQLELDIEHEKLIYSKIHSNFERLKSQIDSQEKLKGVEKEKSFEMMLKQKQEELQQISNDIEKLKNFNALSVIATPNNDHLELQIQIQNIKEWIIMKQKDSTQQNSVNIEDAPKEIMELLSIIPDQLTKIDAQIDKLTQQNKTMIELQKIIGQDIMTGLDFDMNQFKEAHRSHSNIFGLVTEFKIGVETQEPIIKNELNRIQQQIKLLKTSKNLLEEMKNKAEQAQKFVKLQDESSQMKLTVLSQNLRREFQNFLKDMLKVKHLKSQKSNIFKFDNPLDQLGVERAKLHSEILVKHSGQNYHRKIRGPGLKDNNSRILNAHNQWLLKNFRPITDKV
eukprot:403350878